MHDSLRVDGGLDNCCLRCGLDGYWHDGQRLDVTHPSGKVLFRLPHNEEAERLIRRARMLAVASGVLAVLAVVLGVVSLA